MALIDFDLEHPRFTSAQACAVSGASEADLKAYRRNDLFDAGVRTADRGVIYSALNVIQLSILVQLSKQRVYSRDAAKAAELVAKRALRTLPYLFESGETDLLDRSYVCVISDKYDVSRHPRLIVGDSKLTEFTRKSAEAVIVIAVEPMAMQALCELIKRYQEEANDDAE